MPQLHRLAFCIAFTALALTAALNASASAYTYKVIHDFCSQRGCKDGTSPEAALIMDSAGNLYGTTFGGGGGSDSGVVFELVPDGGDGKWKSHVLYAFCCGADGRAPNRA